MEITTDTTRTADTAATALLDENEAPVAPDECDHAVDLPFEPRPEQLDEPFRRMLVLFAVTAGETLDPAEVADACELEERSVRLAVVFLLAWGAVVRSNGNRYRLRTDGTSGLARWAQGLIADPPHAGPAMDLPDRELACQID